MSLIAEKSAGFRFRAPLFVRISRVSDQSPQSKKLVPHRIEIKLRNLNQLFNTMDPSPFLEKDLDADAEEFIVNWAPNFRCRRRLCSRCM